MTAPAAPNAEPAKPERLHKLMAEAGVASRRASEKLIAAGRVLVNGKPTQVGDRASWNDRIEVDGIPLINQAALAHFLVNKPAGVLCTASDPHGRPTVVELVDHPQRLYPVGRLDADSEGAIIVTNDGELTQLLTHPSYGVAKEYLVHVQGKPVRSALRRLREGVELADGVTAPARVSVLGTQPAAQPDGSTTVLSMVIHEGRNRQIRRMLAAVGHPVQRLVRVRIGPLTQDIPPGESRRLTQAEVRSLYQATAATTSTPDDTARHQL